MSLKDAMAREAVTVFANSREWGESVNIDGHIVTADMADVATKMNHGMDPDIPTMHRVVSVPVQSMPDGYTPSETVQLNGEEWSVESAIVDCGTHVLRLTRNDHHGF